MTIFQAAPQPGDIKSQQDGAVVEQVTEPVADTAAPEPGVADPPAVPADRQEDTPADPPVRRVAGIDRAAIGRKFAERRREDSGDIPFEGSFAREEVYAGGLTRPQPEPAVADEDAPGEPPAPQAEVIPPVADAPRKLKVKVRHEERELTEDEVIAAAQKTLAADDYLGEARQLLDDAKRLASSSPHQGRGETAPGEDGLDPTDPPAHQPDEDLVRTVEKIQYSPPEEAARAFEEAVAKAVGRSQNPEETRKAVYLHHREIDVGAQQRAYEEFLADSENAALVKDPLADQVMQSMYHRELAADLKKLGIPDDQIPKERDKLVETHRFHRLHGRPVRNTQQLLAASKQGFVNWKGGSPSPTPTPAPRPGEVNVNVDRTERRQAMPHQPQRASAPPAAQPRPNVASSRSSAAQKILAKRGRAIVS